MSADYYYTIEGSGTAEFKDRGSKFLAYALPITDSADFKTRLRELKEQHPKAAHHCFAYRLGTDGNNFRSSDDGEPSGSAGKQILAQIDSKHLTNVVVIVARYFGGTLLGLPGLTHAYKTVALLALQTTPIVQRAIEINYHLEFDYTKMNEVMLIVKKCKCSILKQQTELFSTLDIGIPRANLELAILRLNEISGVKVNRA